MEKILNLFIGLNDMGFELMDLKFCLYGKILCFNFLLKLVCVHKIMIAISFFALHEKA